MFRILRADKDSYITSKFIVGSASYTSNVGQAGTLDLFKLYNETVVSGASNVTELSRVLVHVDLSPLAALTGSSVNIATSSFKCHLSLKDIYGGQTTPSNFTIAVCPLAKPFSEGRGSDVVAYRDLDSVNWLTASISGGVITPWTSGGAAASGNLGTANLDFYVSGNLGAGLTSLCFTQDFTRGDEDLLVDITQLVSATLVGTLPDYGYRVSFVGSQETDGITRFVKRFSSRHTRNPFQHPAVLMRYNDSFVDNQAAAFFDIPNTVAVYNTAFGDYRNFTLSGTAITGSNSLRLDLVSSKSVTYWTSSFSSTHSQSINHLTTSYSYFSASFTGSQLSVGTNAVTGVYYANVAIASTSASLISYLGADTMASFLPVWKSLDGGTTFTSGAYFSMTKVLGKPSNVAERNFVVSMVNLKPYYAQSEVTRLRVFIQDFDVALKPYQLPVRPPSQIYQTMHWRLLHAFTREILVPFDLTYGSTKLSADGEGMWFDFFMADFDINQVYELEFLVRENAKDHYVTNQGFRFKVVP